MPVYTVNDHAGNTLAFRASAELAYKYAQAYENDGADVDALAFIEVGETWRSHPDWRGITIVRVA
jgi:hypothetical protein